MRKYFTPMIWVSWSSWQDATSLSHHPPFHSVCPPVLFLYKGLSLFQFFVEDQSYSCSLLTSWWLEFQSNAVNLIFLLLPPTPGEEAFLPSGISVGRRRVLQLRGSNEQGRETKILCLHISRRQASSRREKSKASILITNMMENDRPPFGWLVETEGRKELWMSFAEDGFPDIMKVAHHFV